MKLAWPSLKAASLGNRPSELSTLPGAPNVPLLRALWSLLDAVGVLVLCVAFGGLAFQSVVFVFAETQSDSSTEDV